MHAAIGRGFIGLTVFWVGPQKYSGVDHESKGRFGHPPFFVPYQAGRAIGVKITPEIKVDVTAPDGDPRLIMPVETPTRV